MTIKELQRKIDLLDFEHFRLSVEFDAEAKKCIESAEVSPHLNAIRVKQERIDQQLDDLNTIFTALQARNTFTLVSDSCLN